MSVELHILEVTPALDPPKLRKLARRYAMTGGFELVLKNDLTIPELTTLIDMYVPELVKYPEGSLQRKASLAGRILGFIAARKDLPDAERARVAL